MSRCFEMERSKSKISSSSGVYQCIVCQMTTVSMGTLHRHQTYQHTPEELSLSTIGLQCLLINNLRAANGIVYDNSWLCDPKKHAEFYTVSAKLLNDPDDNGNRCIPIDYAVERKRDRSHIKDQATTLENYGSTDHGTATLLDSAIDFSRAETACRRTDGYKTVDTPVDDTLKTLIEKIKAEDSEITAYEANCNFDNLGTETVVDRTSELDDGYGSRRPEIEDTELDAFVKSIEGLCDDLKSSKNPRRKPTKRAPKNAATTKHGSKFRKPRGPAKRAKISERSTMDRASTETTNEDGEIAGKKNSASLPLKERDSQRTKNSTSNKRYRTNENSVKRGSDGRHMEMTSNHIRTEVSDCLEPESKTKEQDVDVGDNDKSSKQTERSMTLPVPENFTFPCYPPDMNDCSILILDPVLRQLVWTSVAIVDDQDEQRCNETHRKTTILPELTDADLRDSEICENTTISSDPRIEDGIGNKSNSI